jgi:methylmalonyl-CoA/ethylmalonyl-CoA epimerase
MKLHHVGIVVKDLREYGVAYASMLGLVPDSNVFHDPTQKVRVQFWRDVDSHVSLELIEPTSPDSPVQRALTRGGGLNHLCYEVDDIEQAVQRCLDSGALLAGPVAPAAAFGGRRIAFLFFAKLSLIEFVEAGGLPTSPNGEIRHAS